MHNKVLLRAVALMACGSSKALPKGEQAAELLLRAINDEELDLKDLTKIDWYVQWFRTLGTTNEVVQAVNLAREIENKGDDNV